MKNTAQSGNVVHREGFEKVVVLDGAHAYIEPKTAAADEKLRAEIGVLCTVNAGVEIQTPLYLGQDAGRYVFTRLSGSIFSQDFQESQTEEQVEVNTTVLARFMSQLHHLPVSIGTLPWDQNELQIDLKANLRHKNVRDYLRTKGYQSGLAAAIETLDDIAPSEADTALLHADLHGSNILVDSQSHVSGIVDFGDCTVGDIHYEFKYFPGCGQPFFERLATKYEAESGRRLNRDRLQLYHYLTAFCHLFYSITTGDTVHRRGREVWVTHVVAAHSDFSHERCLKG